MALSSGKIDKYEYLTSEEVPSSGTSQIIQPTMFPYSPLGKAFEKQTEKQVDTLKSLNLPNRWGKTNWEYISKTPVEWFDYW